MTTHNPTAPDPDLGTDSEQTPAPQRPAPQPTSVPVHTPAPVAEPVASTGEQRLDSALSDRGLVRSRTVAARLIAEGLVTVDGSPVVKASAKVRDSQVIAVAPTDHYVSRGAHKLVAALDAFELPVADRTAMDAGASTGGFSQVLLERGVGRVIAVDVGHGQLSPTIKADPRVTLVEGFNLRYATAETIAGASGITDRPDLVVGDLSFISLTTVLPALVATAAEGADFVLLIKPQFEVGRGGIREGVVHDPGLRADAVSGVLWAGWDLGLGINGLIASPIAGGAGNHEYLVWMRTGTGTNPTEWIDRITVLVGA
ncbi:TlyA family RNA methyltransferase [Cryobacterium arcticum]|uniref:Hemolysin n=1 Tax=Cryobacterium arcticum TaxID=670052 RepID=A0A1B1BHX8_9MICO|nr:TlyA family RNA methyltransferase [Cryobacterium arcticum]ANP72160.1 Hemolysin [Cryobacterium arcticum]